MEPLTKVYHDWLCTTIDEKGVTLPFGFALGSDDGLSAYALDLTPKQAYAHMLAECALKKPREMIFGLDRFAKPGQGTTLGDLIAGHHFVAGKPTRPFIVEYQHEPRIVRPIDWNNMFWNATLLLELRGNITAMLTRS